MQYTVQQNETIMDVAKKTGADPKELMFINYIDESIPIEMGDILEVPGEGGGEMKNFQLGGSVQNQMPQQKPGGQKLPMMGSKLPDSGMRNKNLIQSAPQKSVSKMPAGAMQAQKGAAKRFGKTYGQGGKGSPLRPKSGGPPGRPPMPGGPNMPGQMPGGKPPMQGRPQDGGSGSQWMDKFLSRRQFRQGGPVPSPQQGGQAPSSTQSLYANAMRRVQGGEDRKRRFAAGGSVAPLPVSPQASGLGGFQQRQQQMAPQIPYAQGNLGQGPQSQNAQGLASLGRGGDTMLMHVNKGEVNQMGASINPETGLPEAFAFLAALPAILGAVSSIGGIVGGAMGGGGGGGQAAPAAPPPVQKAPYKEPADPRQPAAPTPGAPPPGIAPAGPPGSANLAPTAPPAAMSGIQQIQAPPVVPQVPMAAPPATGIPSIGNSLQPRFLGGSSQSSQMMQPRFRAR
jgi:hypothetical protein